MASKKKTREEILQKKREAERKCRLKIKQDPVRNEEQKKKEHERYLKKKSQKKVLPINEMTDRKQRKQRKIWRETKRKSRNKQRKEQELERNLRENTPPDSDEEMAQQEPPIPRRQPSQVKNRTEALKRIRAKHRKKRFLLSIKQKKQIDELRLKVKMYQKRYERLKNKEKSNLEKKVENIIKSGSAEISKNLMRGEVLKEQLKYNYLNLNSEKMKQLFTNMICGKILKKYKLLSRCHSFSNRRQIKKNELNYISSRKSKANKNIKNKIKLFLEQDEHSRMCPGKNEFVRKGNQVEQKRFLNDSLKNLHQKFNSMYPEYKCSYTLFWQNCPFYIKHMKIQDRETCKCIIHANMEHLISTLIRNKIINEKNPKEVINSVCCSSYNTQCLLRSCSICKNKTMHIANIPEKEINYFKWINVKETIYCQKSKKEKVVSKITKKVLSIMLNGLVNEFNEMLPKFLCHEGKILHQYIEMRQLKNNLNENEVLIHMDFSENYAIKYGEEIQSFHFGASRKQITLHTVVVYSKSSNGIKQDCYCTVSSSLAHNVPAIWAHLFPILERLPKNITTLHFLSDSPATQYRNKMMFYFLANELQKYYSELVRFTWNYSETGHGKGAPDGIGGTCKRIADRFVSYGNDITNVSTLMEVLQSNCTGINFFQIDDNDIQKIASSLPKHVQPFKGTLEVHQVVSGVTISNLHMRKLSCFQCQSECLHFDLGCLEYENEFLEEEEVINIIPINSHAEKLKYNDVYSSSSSSTSSSPDCTQDIKKGTFVLVTFPGTKGKKYRYVSLCLEDPEIEEREVEIKVVSLKSINTSKTKFKILDDDESYVKYTQITKILSEPCLTIENGQQLYEFKKKIDVYEL